MDNNIDTLSNRILYVDKQILSKRMYIWKVLYKYMANACIFYDYLFSGTVYPVKYSILVFILLLVLWLILSYVINLIYNFMISWNFRLKKVSNAELQ